MPDGSTESTRPAASADAATAVPPLRPGQTVFVGRPASVQFDGPAGFNFRIIRIDDQPTYDGWTWLDGYQLHTTDIAIQRRTIFIQPAGLRPPRRPRNPAGTHDARRRDQT
jgi:hypothetical protein